MHKKRNTKWKICNFWEGHSADRMYCSCILCSYFSVRGNFLLFTLSGWSKRALIARGSQGFFLEGDCYVLSLSLSKASIQPRRSPPKFGLPSPNPPPGSSEQPCLLFHQPTLLQEVDDPLVPPTLLDVAWRVSRDFVGI